MFGLRFNFCFISTYRSLILYWESMIFKLCVKILYHKESLLAVRAELDVSGLIVFHITPYTSRITNNKKREYE